MKNKKILFGLFAILILASITTIIWRRLPNVKGVSTTSVKNIAGVILPHHGLASSLLDTSYKKLSSQKQYSTIVIIGPNHFTPESGLFTTSPYLQADIKISESVKNLIRTFPDMHVSEDIISHDHAVMIHLPYIRQYFPQASIIPVLVSPSATLDDIKKFSHSISSQLPTDTLYIASIDFSHDSTMDEGLKNNEETIAAIRTFDIKTLLSFTDKHLDSPNGATAWLMAVRNRKATSWELWDSSHSGFFLDDPRSRGTSYVAGIFYN